MNAARDFARHEAIGEALTALDNTLILLDALEMFHDEIYRFVNDGGSFPSPPAADWLKRASALRGCVLDYAFEARKQLQSTE